LLTHTCALPAYLGCALYARQTAPAFSPRNVPAHYQPTVHGCWFGTRVNAFKTGDIVAGIVNSVLRKVVTTRLLFSMDRYRSFLSRRRSRRV